MQIQFIFISIFCTSPSRGNQVNGSPLALNKKASSYIEASNEANEQNAWQEHKKCLSARKCSENDKLRGENGAKHSP